MFITYLLLLSWINYFSFVLLRYFIAVQKCLGLYSDDGQYSADDVERLSTLYNSLKEKYAWSSAVKVKTMFNCDFICIAILFFFVDIHY